MSNFIENVLRGIDNDLTSYRDIDIYKKLTVTCIDKRYSITLLDYVYTYYQVFQIQLKALTLTCFLFLKARKLYLKITILTSNIAAMMITLSTIGELAME